MTVRFQVPEMSCGHCKQTIESAVQAVTGVNSVVVSLEDKLVTVDYDAQLDDKVIETAIVEAGYAVEARV